jgi:hypothetical protein
MLDGAWLNAVETGEGSPVPQLSQMASNAKSSTGKVQFSCALLVSLSIIGWVMDVRSENIPHDVCTKGERGNPSKDSIGPRDSLAPRYWRGIPMMLAMDFHDTRAILKIISKQ